MHSDPASRVPLLLTLALVAVLVLNACGGSNKHANVRVLNTSLGYQSVDVYDNNNGTDNTLVTGVGYETLTNYASLDSGKYEVKFKVAGSSDTLDDITGQSFTDDSHTTYIAYGTTGNFGELTISEDVGDQDSGKSGIQIYNVTEAGALDVYLTDSSTDLTDASATFSSVASGSSASMVTLDQGTYRLRVTGAGDKTDLRLDVASITLTNEKNATIILTSTTGGVLVNALFLPQQGTLSKYENGNARIRAAIGMSDGTLANVTVGGVSLLSNATVGTISGSYSQLTAGSTAVSLTIDSNAVTVADQTLAAGGDYTLLVWSNADGNQTTLVSDDNHIPTTSGKLTLRLLNGMSSLGDPISLLANFSQVASSIPVGQGSGTTQIDAGTGYELDVNDATNGSPLVSRTDLTLSAQDVYTLFMSGGGTATVNFALHKDAGN